MRVPVNIFFLFSSLLVSETYPKSVPLDLHSTYAQYSPEEEGAEEFWLEDYTNRKALLQEMQSDSAFGQLSKILTSTVCPPPPKVKEQARCDIRTCKSDKECLGDGQKCCNNGCVFTCMATMPSAPVVDWLREPPRRIKSRTSWLVPGPEQPPQGKVPVETCTTSMIWESDEDPLLCPQGFVCHIEDLGDPANGIANSGQCIKEHSKYSGEGHKPHHFRLKASVHEDGDCVMEKSKSLKKQNIPNGDKFIYHKHTCECHKGAVTCIVGRARARKEQGKENTERGRYDRPKGSKIRKQSG